jgi:hypothetical protein
LGRKKDYREKSAPERLLRGKGEISTRYVCSSIAFRLNKSRELNERIEGVTSVRIEHPLNVLSSLFTQHHVWRWNGVVGE